MASDKDIGFKLEINGVEKSISSIKDLKGAIKDLQDVAENSDIGSEQYKQAIEDLEKLNDQLKEVTQTEKQAAKAAEDLAKAEKEAAKETGDLRKQFEVLEDELFMLAGQGKQNTERFRELTIEAAGLNKKIDQVNQSLSGGGAERAEAGFSKFGDSLKKLDFKGVAQGAKLMGTALAATGVMFIVQAIGYLIANFDELSSGSNALSKYLKLVGNVISEIINTAMNLINTFTDFLGITSQAERDMEAMGKAAIDAFTKSKEALAEQTAEMDRNIKVAKAMGKNTVEMEIEKQKAIIETNKQYLLQLEQMAKTRAITDEERKLVKEAAKSIKDAKAEITVIESNDAKDKKAKQKESDDKAKANREKQLADEKKLFSDIQRERLASMADRDKAAYMQLELDKQKAIEEIEATKASEAVKQQARYSAYQEYVLKVEALDKQIADKKLADEEKAKADAEAKRLAAAEKEKQQYDELVALKKKRDEEDLARQQAVEDARFQIAQNSINSLQGLSDMYFLFKTKNLEKGSAEELRQAKRQFEINKALQIASATISGIQGVQNALMPKPNDLTPEPIATILRVSNAVATGIAAAASIAKIASTKFEGGGGGSMATPSAPSAQPIPAPPTVSNPNANIEGSKFDEQGNKISNGSTMPAIQVNATVGVDEISAKTNRVNVLEKQSTF